MSVGVCNSPKIEMSNESSCFNLHHMPGTFLQNSTEKASHSPGYFDIMPLAKSSPNQTPYFDAVKTGSTTTNSTMTTTQSPEQTPFFDCETMSTPYFEQLQNQHGFRFSNEAVTVSSNNSQNKTINNPNNNNNNNNFTTSLPYQSTPMTPSNVIGFPLNFSAKTSFQDGMVTPSWVTNGSFHAKLPCKPKSAPPKRPSIHSLSPLTPVSFETFKVDDVAELLKQYEAAPKQNEHLILLLDLRSGSNFTSDRIKTALNICIPSTLLKRCSFSAERILETLLCEDDKDVFKNWPLYQNIVLYDNDLGEISENCPIYHVCKKFKKESVKAKIGWLKGGFSDFSQKYPDLCEKTPPCMQSQQATSTLPRRRATSGDSRRLGPFTCPTPIVEVAGVNPFFSNIRQNIELSVGITETIPIRVSEGIDRSCVPEFMHDFIYKPDGSTKLAEVFQEIERIEQRRLQLLMLHNNNQATAENPFSIQAGMEKGTKNRYNNIWPYDHSRVKLSKCNPGECDYVNASFIQAKGCPKKYIATQGPLPTTYADFWRVVWEQNSRVIVMLTKEEEAGRIQCHRYWAQCTKKPCTFGPFSLVMLSETMPLFTETGARDDSIIFRKFSLLNTNLPNEPAHEIIQLHFLGWPDFGIPESPHQILKLIDAANEAQSQVAAACELTSQSVGPMVVHCSAGCGRTGAFCTIDSVLTTLETSGSEIGKLDVVQSTVASFREQRLSMVQTLRQYVFCYEAVLWKLAGVA